MKYRLLNIVSIMILVILLSVNDFVATVPWWYFIVLVLAYLLIVFYGCVRISSDFFMPVACKANTKEHVVALSFDDGPHPTYSQRVLDTLKEYDVPATFFCIGKNIRGNQAILKRIKDEGHIAGNHSYTHHFWFDMFGSRKMFVDMRQMDTAVMTIIGVKPALFRPPYGVMNPNLKKAIKRGGYTPVGWSIRSLDTVIKDKQKLLSRIMKQIKPGDIILLHDSVEITADILPELIEQIKNKGFRIVRLDKMLNVKAYE